MFSDATLTAACEQDIRPRWPTNASTMRSTMVRGTSDKPAWPRNLLSAAADSETITIASSSYDR